MYSSKVPQPGPGEVPVWNRIWSPCVRALARWSARRTGWGMSA